MAVETGEHMILKKKQAQSHKRGESPTITLAREIDGTYCCSGQMCFEGHAVSIIGTRSEQQDSYAMLTMHAEQSDGPEALLAIVCDGIGGFSAGQEASSIGVASIIEAFQAAHRPLSDFARTFEEGICLADKRVVALAKALGSKAGTTAVAVYEESGKLYWGCVGDSRAYLLRDSKLSCLTRDHNYALTLQEKVNKGLITQQAADADPERESLISFIGMNDVTHIDTSEHGMTMLDGDVMLLCSDGLYKSLSAAEIADIICQYVERPSFLPGVLTAAALAAIAALIVVAVLFFAPQQRLSMKDIEPCTITTHFDEGLPITSDIRKMADEMLQEDGDVVSIDGGNNEGTGNVCFVTQWESVPSNAADLNKLIRSLDESDYPLLQKYSDRFSGENWIALGFDVPVVFYNAKLMSLYDIDIPYTENKDSYNEKRTIEDFVSMVEPIVQVEECLSVVAADSATGIAGLDDYIQEQALDVFCANNGAVMYIGMLSDIPFVQEHLPGYYAVGPLPSECNFMEHISYDCIAYIPENENENILDASMCYLSYYLSEDIQTEMYITNTSVLPMEKVVLSAYINEKYPGTGWLMDFFK